MSVGIVLPYVFDGAVYIHGVFHSDRLILAGLHAHGAQTLDVLALNFFSIGGPVIMAAPGVLITLTGFSTPSEEVERQRDVADSSKAAD